MKPTIQICGEDYEVEVRGGIRFIGGISAERFIDKLIEKGRWDEVLRLAAIGIDEVRKVEEYKE